MHTPRLWLYNLRGCTLVLLVFLVAQAATPVLAQLDKETAQVPITHTELRVQPIRTDTPKQTFATFLRLRRELEAALLTYRQTKSRELLSHMTVLADQFAALIDLANVPTANRRQTGLDTMRYLLDIFGRVELPDLDSVPDEEALKDDQSVASWRVPRTPIRISQTEDVAREGEFLFNSNTIIAARRFYHGIEDIPLKSSLQIQSWNDALREITGPLIPAALQHAIPNALLATWLDTPIWKVMFVSLMFLLVTFLLERLYNVTERRRHTKKLRNLLLGLVTPVAALAVFWLVDAFVTFEMNVAGRFAAFVDYVFALCSYLAVSWTFWILSRAFFEWIVTSPRIEEGSLDANLLRLSGRVGGSIGVVVILAYGAQELGLPVLSVLAGLGIGGLAVALAIRPTLENLIGGVILYIDQPVRVGDFCSFGVHTGHVESIGMRSTQVRARDRTLITIPNASFADLEIINWAQCDRMLIDETIGLRYETTPDQLRHVLVKMREMFHAHPKIDNETVRIRFSGFGTSSLDIAIRVYALTREWNDFFAIKEDVLMRVNDIVSESGSGFAFPSQTLYMGQDHGVEKELGQAADEEVKSWRKHGKLPFPRLSGKRIEELRDTLDYPPKGSVELSSDTTAEIEAEELSAEPLSDGPPSTEPDVEEKIDEKKSNT